MEDDCGRARIAPGENEVQEHVDGTVSGGAQASIGGAFVRMGPRLVPGFRQKERWRVQAGSRVRASA